MYVGRIVAVGKTLNGKLSALYRVSCRSFPNRQTVKRDKVVSIIPKEGYEKDIYKNAFIAYDCLCISAEYAVVANGTHTNMIMNRLLDGVNVRDSMISVLYGMDFEHDHLNTPRIAGVVSKKTGGGCLGIVRKDALLIREFQLDKGNLFYVATYNHDYLSDQFKDNAFNINNETAGCDYILGQGIFADIKLPVSAACALENQDSFNYAAKQLK